MANSKNSFAGNATPGKLVLIAVLAVVLVVVLIAQFGGQDRSVVKPRKRIDSPRNTAGKATGEEIAGETAATFPEPKSRWPEFVFAEVLAHDPFATPSAMLPPQTAAEIPTRPPVAQEVPVVGSPRAAQQENEDVRREDAIKNLQAQGVDMILIGSESKHAVVGSRMVTIGDTLYGFVVSDIRTDGIILADSEVFHP